MNEYGNTKKEAVFSKVLLPGRAEFKDIKDVIVPL